MHRRHLLIVLLTTGIILPALLGCEGGRFGSELRTRPKPRALPKTDAQALRLPADKPFQITLPQARHQPGLGGEASADATAVPAGEATAQARAAESGTAEALFQIGDTFKNESERQLDVRFTVRFRYAFETEANEDVNLPDAMVGVRLYGRNQLGRLVRDLPLLEHTTESGPTRRSGQEEVGFKITMAPGDELTVFLAGRSFVEIAADRTAAARLELNDIRMEIQSSPAPAVKARPDGRS
jgi:hypothetical protein